MSDNIRLRSYLAFFCQSKHMERRIGLLVWLLLLLTYYLDLSLFCPHGVPAPRCLFPACPCTPAPLFSPSEGVAKYAMQHGN